MPETPVVKLSTMCTPAEAVAGGTPSTLTSRVLEMTPKAIPSAPSTSWAAKPTAMNGSKAAKSRSAQFMQSPPLRSAQELLLLFSTKKIENHSPAEARLFRPIAAYLRRKRKYQTS